MQYVFICLIARIYSEKRLSGLDERKCRSTLPILARAQLTKYLDFWYLEVDLGDRSEHQYAILFRLRKLYALVVL